MTNLKLMAETLYAKALEDLAHKMFAEFFEFTFSRKPKTADWEPVGSHWETFQQFMAWLWARRDAAEDGDGWKPIDTVPKDGSHILAWAEVKADEFDEEGRLIKRDVVERYAVVAYWVFGGLCELPFNHKPRNLRFTHWQQLPDGPTRRPE